MTSALPVPPPGFDDLTPQEKIDYVAALWDRIFEQQESLPLSDEHKALLRERLAQHQADPSAARPWDEVRKDIEQTLASRKSR